MSKHKKAAAPASTPVLTRSVVTPELKDIPPFSQKADLEQAMSKAASLPAESAGQGTTAPGQPTAILSMAVQDTDERNQPRVSRMVLGPRCKIGRQPPKPEDGYTAFCVVHDPTMQVSRRHLECGAAGPGRAWIMDMGSANGTWVRTRAGLRVDCMPHEKMVIEQGDVVHFGQCTAWLS